MAQNGFKIDGKDKVLDPSVATKLLKIMERLPEVVVWHETLKSSTEAGMGLAHDRVQALLGVQDRQAPAPSKRRPQVEQAIDAIIDHGQALALDERMALMERVFGPLDIKLATAANPKGEGGKLTIDQCFVP